MKIAKLMLVISLALALIVSALMFRYLEDLKEEASLVDVSEIVVAVQTIAPGTKVTRDMLGTEAVDVSLIRADTIVSYEDIVGFYAIDHILVGEPISNQRILTADSSAIEMNLEGNHRAVTLVLPPQDSVANFISTGDYIDIMVYLAELSDDTRVIRPNIAKLILQKIEVLAINKNAFRQDSRDIDPSVEPGSIFVTLSIPVFDMEKLYFAEKNGALKIALRPVEDNNIYETDGAVWEDLFVNDQGMIKDFFPQYDIAPPSDNVIVSGNYTYTRSTYYTVQPGDTLRSISMDFYGTEENYTLLQEVNNIGDANLIISGTGIKVPVLE